MMPRLSEPVRRASVPPKLNRFLDLNTDFGQTADRHFFTGKERTLLHYVSSVNIPCCVHDGDPAQVIQDIQTARQNNCVVGAHIAYPDPKHFGYNTMDLDESELEAWILLQLGAFSALCRASKADFDHVRPHGALYEQMIQSEQVAATVARAVRRYDQWMTLVAPISPVWERLQVDIGLQVAQEAYLGKRVNADGTLVLGSQQNESLHPQGVIEQVRQLAADSSLTTQDGTVVKVQCKTMHLSPKLQGNMMIAERINAMLGQPVPLALSAAGSSGWA
jgi:UPF0271 protein